MKNDILVFCIAVFVFNVSMAVSCDQLDGIQRLACEKSVHKRGLKRALKQDAVIDTSANIMRTTAHQQKQVAVKKKPKIRYPHNRKPGASKTAALTDKKDDKRTKKAHSVGASKVSPHAGDAGKTLSGASTENLYARNIADSGLPLGHDQVLQSDMDAQPDFVMPSRMEMLASDADTMYSEGIGDAELYRVY